MSKTYYFNPAKLRDAAYKLCRESGSPHEEAELVAKRLIKYLKDSPVLDGKEVLYPGELEVRLEEEIRKTVIPLPARNVESLQKEMDRYEVPVKLKGIGSPTPLS